MPEPDPLFVPEAGVTQAQSEKGEKQWQPIQ
jgi:hypothetical protein